MLLSYGLTNCNRIDLLWGMDCFEWRGVVFKVICFCILFLRNFVYIPSFENLSYYVHIYGNIDLIHANKL